MLNTYSSPHASFVCGAADEFLRKSVSAEGSHAIRFTLIDKCANRSSHLVIRALYVLMDRLRLMNGSNAWRSVNIFTSFP